MNPHAVKTIVRQVVPGNKTVLSIQTSDSVIGYSCTLLAMMTLMYWAGWSTCGQRPTSPYPSQDAHQTPGDLWHWRCHSQPLFVTLRTTLVVQTPAPTPQSTIRVPTRNDMNIFYSPIRQKQTRRSKYIHRDTVKH